MSHLKQVQRRDDMTFQAELQKLDLTNVVATVQEELGLSAADTERAEALYRQYLTLCHKYPEMQVVPPKLADKVWHEHITNTRKYAADCDALFGMFIHHQPGRPNAEAEFEKTKELYQQEFDVDLEMYGIEAAELQGASRCP